MLCLNNSPDIFKKYLLICRECMLQGIFPTICFISTFYLTICNRTYYLINMLASAMERKYSILDCW